MVALKNNLISIVPFALDMVDDVWRESHDEDNIKFVPDEVFETREDALDVVKFIISNYKNNELPLIYAIIRNSDQKYLGYVQLVEINEGYEIGYHINESVRGNNYATTSVLLFLDYLKNELKIDKIYGIALKENKASIRVLEKCGFKLIFDGVDDYQGAKKEIIKTVKIL